MSAERKSTPDKRRRLSLPARVKPGTRLAIVAAGLLLATLAAYSGTSKPDPSPSPASAPTLPRATLSGLARINKPMKSYASLMGSGLFTPRVTDRTNRRNSTGRAGADGLLPLPPAGIDGLPGGLPTGGADSASSNGLRYVGRVTVDGSALALMTRDNDYGYYRIGEKVAGYTLVKMDGESVVLRMPGQPVLRLPKTSAVPPSPGSSDRTAIAASPASTVASDASVAPSTVASPGSGRRFRGDIGASEPLTEPAAPSVPSSMAPPATGQLMENGVHSSLAGVPSAAPVTLDGPAATSNVVPSSYSGEAGQ